MRTALAAPDPEPSRPVVIAGPTSNTTLAAAVTPLHLNVTTTSRPLLGLLTWKESL